MTEREPSPGKPRGIPGGPKNLGGVEPPAPSAGARLMRYLGGVLALTFAGMVVVYSLLIGRAPWQWGVADLRGFATFSRERVESARDKLAEIDWANLKTKVTDKTRGLWDALPELEKKLEERIDQARGKPAPAEAPATPAAPTTTAPGAGAKEKSAYELGLAAMRQGIGHYRKSVEDRDELVLAKKSFEEAQGHLEKAVREEREATRRREAGQTLEDCNKYLEDCRLREKT